MPPTPPITIDAPDGTFQARVFSDTGGIALVGPDPTGAAQATIVQLEPIEVQLGGHAVTLGRLIGPARPSAAVLEFDHELGGGKATARVSFPTDGVLRYEIVDWHGQSRRRPRCP
ncbi:hypothetical protein [Limnoglobus roseus]|uniref:Uncharacterized protein n=1 Tax=Limnoglobus roseus TaxID=2598579 RepID=A0A5C1A3I3_9BACT|nr:hypothetical protein [Limnoglobus roseus]QEL13651.1 hypothetical protein PX52LOC_00509 [Limnoglobus roseus]